MKKLLITAFTAMCAVSPALAMDDAKTMNDTKMMTQHSMQKIDKNSDSMASRDEMEAYGDMMFDEADTNNDDMLSMDEMMASHKKMHDEMMVKKMDK